MPIKYSRAQLEHLKSGYKLMSLDELTESFNSKFGLFKTRQQIHATLKNHRFKCGRKAGSILKGISLLYTPEQVEFIKQEYPGRTRRELLELFNKHFEDNKTLNQIIAYVKNNSIRSGLTGHFGKGSKPWNTGTKGVVQPNSGNFQAGEVPANLKPIGHERIDKDGYILIKVDQVNPYTGFHGWYRHKHVVNWEIENGPVPEDMNLRFKDGNKQNIAPGNLEIVSKPLNFRLNLNQMNAAPDEIKPTIRAISELEVKTFERLKVIK